MFIQTILMAINGITLGILNSKQDFFWPAIGSILYNIGIIVIGLAMAHVWGIKAFAIGVVIGALFNLLVQVPSLLRNGIKYYPSFDLRHPGFRQIMILMLPVLIGLSVTQINLFVTQNLASGLAEGSISALRLAQRIMQLPIGIFGISIAMAVFPSMTAQVERNELINFKRTFSLGLRGIFLITIPAGVGLIALREPIIQLFFQQGKFTAADTSSTAWALLFYCLGLFAYSALQLLNRVFYSLKDTITPVAIGAVSIVLNILFSILLVRTMQDRGLALAYSLAGTVNMLIMIGILKWRLKTIDGFKIIKSFIICTVASVIMYAATRGTVTFMKGILTLAPKLNELIIVVAGIGVGVLTYSIIVLLFRLEETQLILGIVKSRIPGLKS
jgi:putative peptidoglycan lipid II flippase